MPVLRFNISPLWLGILYAISTTFMIAVMNLFVKLLGQYDFHAIELVFIRNLCGLIIISGIIVAVRRNFELFKTSRPKAHLTRSLLGTFGVIFIFAAFIYLPLTTATVLIFTSSLMIPVFSAVLLKESVGPYRWTAVLIGFSGVVIMTGFSTEIKIIGLILALLGALFNALAHVSLRSLADTEHPLTTSFYFMAIGTALTLPIVPFVANGN